MAMFTPDEITAGPFTFRATSHVHKANAATITLELVEARFTMKEWYQFDDEAKKHLEPFLKFVETSECDELLAELRE